MFRTFQFEGPIEVYRYVSFAKRFEVAEVTRRRGGSSMTSALWRPAHCHLLSRIPNDVATLSAQARHEPWSHGVGRHCYLKKKVVPKKG